jgi:hypothetical protein
MTELGHGSNVPGLETTATFDEASDQFIIHTPTLTATKVKINPCLTFTSYTYIKPVVDWRCSSFSYSCCRFRTIDCQGEKIWNQVFRGAFT